MTCGLFFDNDLQVSAAVLKEVTGWGVSLKVGSSNMWMLRRTPEVIAHRLSMAGILVEGLERRNGDIIVD